MADSLCVRAGRAVPAVALLVFLSTVAGCSTLKPNENYTLDARYYPIPVMLNERPQEHTGRAYTAVVRNRSTVATSSSTGYGYGYRVTTTVTTTTRESTSITAQDQIFQRAATNDRLIYITDMYLRRYDKVGVGSREEDITLNVSVVYVERR